MTTTTQHYSLSLSALTAQFSAKYLLPTAVPSLSLSLSKSRLRPHSRPLEAAVATVSRRLSIRRGAFTLSSAAIAAAAAAARTRSTQGWGKVVMAAWKNFPTNYANFQVEYVHFIARMDNQH